MTGQNWTALKTHLIRGRLYGPQKKVFFVDSSSPVYMLDNCLLVTNLKETYFGQKISCYRPKLGL